MIKLLPLLEIRIDTTPPWASKTAPYKSFQKGKNRRQAIYNFLKINGPASAYRLEAVLAKEFGYVGGMTFRFDLADAYNYYDDIQRKKKTNPGNESWNYVYYIGDPVDQDNDLAYRPIQEIRIVTHPIKATPFPGYVTDASDDNYNCDINDFKFVGFIDDKNLIVTANPEQAAKGGALKEFENILNSYNIRPKIRWIDKNTVEYWIPIRYVEVEPKQEDLDESKQDKYNQKVGKFCLFKPTSYLGKV